MAADSVLFLGWNRPVTGREKAAVGLLKESIGYWQKLKDKGDIDAFDIALLDAHGVKLLS